MDHYSISWSNFQSTLLSGFNSLLKDETLVDVTLAADGKYIKAHKTVLSVCSPYFKELFQANPCQHPIVILSNVNYNILCNLLVFMYQGEVSIHSEEISTFIKIAEMLKIEGLTETYNLAPILKKTVEEIVDNIKESNTEEILIKPKEEPLDDSESQVSLKFEDNNIDFEETSTINDQPTKIKETLIESDEDFEEPSSCHQRVRRRRNMDLLPDKSKVRYLKEYRKFKKFCERKNIDYKTKIEKAMLEYLMEKSETMKAPSLSVKYTMIKATLAIEENIHHKFPKVLAFLKRKALGYKSKEARFFTREDISKFLMEAPDDIYLMMKVVLIVGVTGGCRLQELTMMSIDDIEDKGSVLIVKLPSDGSKNQRSFIIHNESTSGINVIEIYRKYMDVRNTITEHKRLFVKYKFGECLAQPLGRNTLATIPRRIAKFLQKPNLNEFTGYCFKKTSSVLMAVTGMAI